MHKLDLKQALKIYEDKYISHPLINALLPKVYMLRPNVEGTYNFTDQNCLIPTREEWEVIKVIVQHFYDKHTDEEIEEYNQKYTERFYREYGAKPKKEKRRESGCVYFLLADNGLVKIGRTKKLKERLDHFTAKLPYKLELIHTIFTDDSYGLEEYFHEKFKDKRQRGEWFKLDQEDIEEVKKYG
jgi:Meiotically up-regulated gene 113